MQNPDPCFPLPQLQYSDIVHQSFFKIQRDHFLTETGHAYDYYSLMTRGPAVIIVGLTPDGSWVLTEEYRHPIGKTLLSCAGGYIDLNEDPLKAAEREFLEETGFSAKTYKLMGRAYPYPGISSQEIFYVCGYGALRVQEPMQEPTEHIRPVIMQPDALNKKICSGFPLDGNLCTALYFFKNESMEMSVLETAP